MKGSRQNRRILFISIGDIYRASSRFRAYWWKDHLERQGFQCRIIPYFRSSNGRVRIAAWEALMRRFLLWKSTYRQILRGAQWADVAILQEALLPRWLLRRVRESVNRLIFDFSDPVHLRAELGRRIGVISLWHEYETATRFRETLRCADYAIVENEEHLKTVADVGCQGFVMPGPANTEFFQTRPAEFRSRIVNIGWTGTPATAALLGPILPVLDRVAERFSNVRLTLVGAAKRPALARMPVQLVPWRLQGEREAVREFDIGLFYLADTPWQRARGGGKLLVYMAAGVPVVASPYGIGSQIVEHGHTGLLAGTPQEWYEALSHLVANAALRQAMSTHARRVAVARYSYEAYLPLMLSLI